MTHPLRIPILKRALTELRRGEANPQLRLGILRDTVYEALVLVLERELKQSLAESDRKGLMEEAIQRASEAVGQEPEELK